MSDQAWQDGTVLFVSGPVTGFDGGNHALFQEATEELRRKGYWVLNPTRQPPGLAYREYVRRAVKDIYRSSGLALLPGWDFSPGAAREYGIARRLGLEAKPIEEWPSLWPQKQAQPAINSEHTLLFTAYLESATHHDQLQQSR
jgi:hypothetical protein